MSDVLEYRPGIGDNSGEPAAVLQIAADLLRPAAVQTDLAHRHAELRGRMDKLLAGVANFHAATPQGVRDEETQAKATDLQAMLASFAGDKGVVETARGTEKRIFLDVGKALDAFFAEIRLPVQAALKTVTAKTTPYAEKGETERRRAREAEARRQAEEARRIEAEARRQAEEARRAAAAAEEARRLAEIANRPPPPESEPIAPTVTFDDAIAAAKGAKKAQERAEAKSADLTRTRGDAGTVGSVVELPLKFELEDIRRVPLRFLMLDLAACKAAEAEARKTGTVDALEIPGVKIIREKTYRARR